MALFRIENISSPAETVLLRNGIYKVPLAFGAHKYVFALSAQMQELVTAGKLLAQSVETLANGITLGELPSGASTDAELATHDALATAHSSVETTFVATFTQAVGAKTVVVRKKGKTVTLELPAGSTADGGGVAFFASGATDVPAAYRPAADISFPIMTVYDDVGATESVGKLVITAAGQMSIYANAQNSATLFADNTTGSFERTAVTYTLA